MIRADARKKALQAFYTPAPLADRVAELAIADAPHVPFRVLEPSAGEGALLFALARVRPDLTLTTLAYDVDHAAVESLRASGAADEIREGDFLQAPVLETDVVVMNPPFRLRACVDHAMRALEWLPSGGRLVAVLPCNALQGRTHKHEAFRARVSLAYRWRVEECPEGSFRESGTLVRTILLVVDV